MKRQPLFVLGALAVVYVGFATGLTWQFDPAPARDRDYFRMQAEAFLAGQAHLKIDRALLDMSEFGGQVHLYWGPGNALPHMVPQLVGREMSACLWTALYSFWGLMVFGATLSRIQQKNFPDGPKCTSHWFLISLAVGSPLFFVTSWSLYPHHQSIALSFLAQCLMLLAYVRFLEEFSLARAAALGVTMTFAVSVRMSNLFLVPGLALGAWLALPSPRFSHGLRCGTIPGLCLGAALGGMMLFNWVRFGDISETGMRYATGESEQRALIYERDALVSPRWVPLNAWGYFAHLPEFEGVMPRVPWSETFPVPARLQDLYPTGMPMVIDTHSVLFMTPLLVSVLLLLVRGGQLTPNSRALATGLGAAAAGVIAFLLCYSCVARRFVLDFLPAWMLVAFIAVHHAIQARPRLAPMLRAAVAIATLWACALHWQLAEVGARKVNALFLLREAAGLSHPIWPPALACLLAICVVIELGRAGALRPVVTTCPAPRRASAC